LSPDWQSDVSLVWRAVAARFRNVSGVAGYDMYNEPNSAPLPPGTFESRWMWPFYARLIDAIGAVDSNHLFIVEGPLLLTPRALDLRPRMLHLAAPNLLYAPHTYVGSIVPPLHVEDPSAVTRSLWSQAEDAQQLPAAIWWGELGVDTGKPFAIDWTDTALDTLDDLQVGWAWWQWRQGWGWGVRNDVGDFVNVDFLRHLARPFVAAGPAGVHGLRGNGVNGTLELLVGADHANQPVVVSWSSSTLPPPIVHGSCVNSVRWEPANARLRIELQSSVGCKVRIDASSEGSV